MDRLPLIPESSDSVLAEAKALEEHVMAGDSLLRHSSGSSDSMLLEVTDLDALFDAHEALKENPLEKIPMTSKRESEDLKVEGPLTPPMFSDSPMKKLKSVSFSKMIQVGDTLQPWSDEDLPDSAGSQISISYELAKQIGPTVEKLNRKIENEKLSGADTVSRVEVPRLDFTLPVAPWNEFSEWKKGRRYSTSTELEAQMKFLEHIKHNELKSAAAWRGVSDLDLKWCWYEFPDFTITLDEKLHGATEFAKIQDELRTDEIARSSGEVWKKEGLRVLAEDEGDEEDEIDPAEFEGLKDIKSLIRKRHLESEEQDQIENTQNRKQAAAARLRTSGHVHLTSVGSGSQQSHRNILQYENTDGQKEAPTELMFGGFSASTALHKFMESQGKPAPAAKGSHKARTNHTYSVQDLTSRTKEPPVVANHPLIKGTGHNATCSKLVMRQPIPSFGLPDASFVISTALLQRRILVREIERLHPKADLIYRDYALSHSVCLEVDIILSPSTGVLLTTLQQIKQAPLPGRVALSPVKEQIARLQLRHERLLVLVSEGLREENSDSRPEDTRDKDFLSDLELFATRLEGSVAVEYVPGGEKEIARAIVENMGKYGLPHIGSDMHDIKLFPAETTARYYFLLTCKCTDSLQWETFLRRAGLNPFAAQFIVASLKIPTVISLPSIQSSPIVHTTQRIVEAVGLSMFVLMRHEDRVKNFQAIMGGRRILDRVGGLLDQRWLSAAHGFKM